MLEGIFVKKAVDLLLDAIKRLLRGRTKQSDRKKTSQLISEAVSELLSIDPDLHVIKAKLATAKSACPVPTPQLLRAQEMFEAAETFIKKKKTKKKSKKKTKKKAAKKKAVKKKAKKKKAKKKKVAKKKSKKKMTKKKAKRKSFRRKAKRKR